MTREIGGAVAREDYRSAMEKLPLATVDIIFCNPEKTKTLLGKRTNEPYAGMWYTFGGRLYKNEELPEAAIRIAKKEVGILLSSADITLGGVLNEINPSSIFEGVNYHAVNVYFAARIDDCAHSLDAQHSEAQWLDVHDPTLHPYVRIKIEGALRAL